uniref:Replication factor A protein 3 n=1 Tax=Anthurium amnicola TaxID=1678845 RepID=A0A1D1Z286_9ARAE
MDTSSPAVFVNSELLKMYLGRRVRTVIQVLHIDAGTITGQSTDGHQLLVKGSSMFPISHFVEVIGVADGNQSIRAEICTDFGESFDTVAYNGLCQLANGDHKNLFL